MQKRLHIGSLVVLLLVVLAGTILWAWRISLHQHAPDQLRAAIRSETPIGSLRPKVEAFMQAQGLGEAYFDYHTGDPRQGTLIIGYPRSQGLAYKLEKMCPWLHTPEVNVVFYFDHKGPDGKLVSYQVSDKPIPIFP